MKNIAQQLAELFERENRRKGRWRKVVTALAAVVVFVTTYALILPGITLEKDPVCGMEEHTHTADCYTQLTSVTKTALVCNAETLQIHQHTQDCYNEDGELVCGYADFVVHTHDENCYDENGSLVCTLPEIELHTHDESCYDADGNLICGKPEVTLHTHDSSCFDENGNLICKKLQVLEHHHSDTCFAEVEQPLDTTALTCTNTDPDHEHTALCYGTWVLTCDKPEHTHTDACYAAQDEDAADEETEEIPADEETEETLAAKPGIMLFADSDDAENDAAANETGDTVEQDDTRADFKNYVKNVTYTSAEYNPDTDQVKIGFQLTFEIKKSDIKLDGSEEYRNFVYTLPENVNIPDSMLGVKYPGLDNGVQGFTYVFQKNDDGTYRVEIDFDHNYVQKKDNFTGYIDFNAIADAENVEKGDYKYEFSDNQTVTIEPEKIKHPDGESMHYDIAVSKSASDYDYVNNKITYTVKVDSAKGTPAPLTLTDVLDLGSLSVNRVELGGVTVETRHSEWYYSDSKSVEGCTMSIDGGTITMSLPGLEKDLDGNGQRYTITYDVYLNEPPAGNQYTVGNKATVTGKDEEKGEIVKDSDETTKTINKDLDLKKSGSYNKETGKIDWTITVNQHQNDIAGATLTDSWFASITDKSTVRFEPSTGIAWGTGDTENALVFSRVNGDANKTTYTITYSTDPPTDLTFTNGVASVNNKATVTPPEPGKPVDSEATVTIDKTVDIDKKGEYEKSTDRIKWTITINQNGNALTVKNADGTFTSAVLTDTMFKDLKQENLTVEPDNGGMKFETNDDGTIKQITFNESAGSQTYTITYYTDVPDPEEGKESVEVKNGTTVTPPDLPPKTDEETVVVNKNVDFNKWGSYDKATDLITWTITVNKNGNDLTDKVLTDSMFSKLEPGNIKITDKEGKPITTGYTINTDSETGKVTNITFTAVENEVNNQTYIITYTTKSGVIMNKTETVTNRVSLDEKTQDVPVHVDRVITIDKQDGYYDAQTNRIWWTIYLNSNYQNIADCQLTDTMFGEIVDDSLQVCLDNGPTVDAQTGHYTIVKTTDEKVSYILFNGVGTTGVNTNRYTIKYATAANPEWDSKVKNNTAAIDPPGDTQPTTDTGKVEIPGEGNVVKTAKKGTLVEVDGKQLLEITWETKVHVPTAGLPKGTVIEDTLADGQWMVWTQVQQWGSMLNTSPKDDDYKENINYWWPGTPGDVYDILLYTKDMSETDEPYHYSNVVSGSGVQDKQFTRYKIVFNSDVLQSYGGWDVWFEYKTYADVSSVQDTQKYSNTVSITPPDGTTKKSPASYEYKKAGVYKTDGNGNKETTSFTTKDGVLTWKVRVRTDADATTLTVTDTLPDGVSLKELKFDYQTLPVDSNGNISHEGVWVANCQWKITGSVSGQNITLNFERIDTTTIPARTEFYIYYTCKINPGILDQMELGTYKEFTNSVTFKQDDKTFPTDKHTQNVHYDKSGTTKNVVDKTGDWDNLKRQLEYSIVLNPDKKDLAAGKDTLTLTDVLSFTYNENDPGKLINVALLPATVKLYEAVYDDQGNMTTGKEITNWSWKVVTSAEGSNHLSTITATVPDSTAMILKYNYNVWLPDGSSVESSEYDKPTVHNTATLIGDSQNGGESWSNVKWEKQETEGGIRADHAYIFYKVEKGNYNILLPGAEFTLYDYSNNEVKNSDGTPVKYTTNEYGSFTIQWHDDSTEYPDEYNFGYNKVYYVQETKAPTGYLMPDEPQKYYFYFGSDEYTTNQLPSPLPDGTLNLSAYEDQVYCENEKATTSITVDKKWVDKSGNPITDKTGSVTFDLYQIANTTPPSESGGGTGGSGTGSTTATFSGSVTLYGNPIKTFEAVEKPVGTMVSFQIVDRYNDKAEPQVTLNGNALTAEISAGKTWTASWNKEYTEKVYTYTFQLGSGQNTLLGSVANNSADDWIISDATYKEPETPDPTPTPEPEKPYKTFTIGTNDQYKGWTTTIDDLPKKGTDEDDNTVYYTYYIKEQNGERYNASYVNNDGIVSGTITVTNTVSDNPGYELPATGGTGTAPLYTMGAALSVSAGLLLVHKKKRRREGRPSS